MKVTRTRKAVATGAAALGILLGAAGITAAATNSGGSSQVSEADHADESSYQSSITAPENASIDGLATITPDQAAAAATSATGGTAGKVELENENGNVVYGVEITKPDGTMLDVKVDAGNGHVLAQEDDSDRGSAVEGKDDDKDTRGGDHADTSETDGAETSR